MIKVMIRKTYSPFQMIFDAIRHQRKQRLMMSYALKISPKQNYCALRHEMAIKNTRVKKFYLPRHAINGV